MVHLKPARPGGLRWDLSKWPTPRLVPASAATIHKNQGSEYPAVIIPVPIQRYAMPQGPALYRRHARQSWSYWSDRSRRSPLRCATCRGEGGGRSSASGCGQNCLSHDSSAWRVEPWSKWPFLQDPRSGSGSMVSSDRDAAHLRQLAAMRPRSHGRQTARWVLQLSLFAAYPVGAYPTADSGCEVFT